MTNRRAFLAAAQAGLLGLPQWAHNAFAQGGSGSAAFDQEVASFWANYMEVPPESLGADVILGRSATGSQATFEREPFLLYYDDKSHELVPTSEVKPNLKSGDVMLNLEVSRYRLNSADQATFSRYQSGGMYLDVQQQQSTGQNLLSMAFSMFSAIFPQGLKGKSGAKPPATSATGTTAAAPAASAPGLQQAGQTQSIGLPNGAGKASLAVFAKDKRKTAFGLFVSAMTAVSNVAQPSYLPLLSMPSIATPALLAMRALVANLQSHGGNQQWLLQGPPMDIVATEEAAGNLKKGAKFNSGYVVAVPKIQISKMKDLMSNVQVIDGFLVPAKVKPTDAYDWIAANPPDASYLTLSTSVQKTKLNNCAVTSVLKA